MVTPKANGENVIIKDKEGKDTQRGKGPGKMEAEMKDSHRPKTSKGFQPPAGLREARNGFSLRARKGSHPTNTLISHSWPPEH